MERGRERGREGGREGSVITLVTEERYSGYSIKSLDDVA